jgi:hypothetical protein
MQRRGTFTDDAILWYVKDYERGDLSEDLQKAYKELGERLKGLNDAMVETGRSRGLPGKEKKGKAKGKER